ncbi:MAG TPA: hypothetical protein VMF32_25440 [Xanthobacteraceae bacterium]|nr:hypothetical protein [Xanthobacteraceae bacterium]
MIDFKQQATALYREIAAISPDEARSFFQHLADTDGGGERRKPGRRRKFNEETAAVIVAMLARRGENVAAIAGYLREVLLLRGSALSCKRQVRRILTRQRKADTYKE